MKTEQEIFQELEILSKQSGFWEVVAFFCWKDNYIHSFNDDLMAAYYQTYNENRLCRTELATIIALACKSGFNEEKLSSDELKEKVSYVKQLLEELHMSFNSSVVNMISLEKARTIEKENVVANRPFGQIGSTGDNNSFIREAIFYGGDGVYKHQYKDLVQHRYSLDEAWIEENKGFSISQAISVISAIEKIQLEKVNHVISLVRTLEGQSYLPIFTFNILEIVAMTGLDEQIVRRVIVTFSAEPQEEMECFQSVDDFNHRNAYPIIEIDTESFICFEIYSLWESFYESPFFWFNKDSQYKSTASKHRGIFTEDFTAERLASVFGHENVFTNIDIFNGKDKAAEIDVLVTFGAFAIVVQAKSKTLTISARKGNSRQLEEDFKKAIQESYDQAYKCSEMLQKDGYIYKNESGETIDIKSNFKMIFPICVISNYFPGLSAQVRSFLKSKITNEIKHPYVMDVFLIDLITELLISPLRVIDYLIKRSNYADTLMAAHELVILSTYIKENLYFSKEYNLIMLNEDLSVDLELEVLARRGEYDGKLISENFLTIFKDTHLGGIIEDIEFSPSYAGFQLGFLLLILDEEIIKQVNESISMLIDRYKEDGCHHYISIMLSDGGGFTIHVNEYEDNVSLSKLKEHCEARKYLQKKDSWVGCCFSPIDSKFRVATYHEGKWIQSDELDKRFSKKKSISHKYAIERINKNSLGKQAKRNNKKIGRNEPCPCDSGKKYKFCCLNS